MSWRAKDALYDALDRSIAHGDLCSRNDDYITIEANINLRDLLIELEGQGFAHQGDL
jgi:hypothetical protein